MGVGAAGVRGYFAPFFPGLPGLSVGAGGGSGFVTGAVGGIAPGADVGYGTGP